jgi:hypothetical protein
LVLQMVSFLLAFPPISYMHSSSTLFKDTTSSIYPSDNRWRYLQT